MLADALNSWLERDTMPTPDFEWEPLNGYDNSPSHAGVKINAETAMSFSAVWACVNKFANAIAKLPINVFKRILSGDGRELAKKHAIFRLLVNKPNRESTPFDFKHLMVVHLLLNGNAYIEILENSAGDPNELFLLNPNQVDIVRDKSTGSLVYTYKIAGEVAPRVLDQRRLIHIKGPSIDGVKGLAPVTQARHAIGLGLALEQFQSQFLKNDATPRGVIKSKALLGKDQKAKMKSEWRLTQGGANRHSVAILDGEMDFLQIGLTMEDAQFLQSRGFQLEEVARWFDVPQHMIGLLARSTNNNIEHQSKEWLDSLDPWLCRIEQGMGRKLLKENEQGKFFLEFARDQTVRMDAQKQEDIIAKRILTGQMSPDEARATRNEPPIPDKKGEIFLQPLSHGPLGTVKADVAPHDHDPNDDDQKPKDDTKDGADDNAQDDADPETRALRSRIMTPIAQSYLERAYKREGKAISAKYRQNARRGSDEEFRSWVASYANEDAKVHLRQIFDPLSSVLAALEVSDPEKMLREMIDFSTESTQAEVRRALELPFEEANKRFEEWEQERAAEVVKIFFNEGVTSNA